MTRPVQEWMTAREAADHLGIPLQRVRELLQDPGPLPDWARDSAPAPVTDWHLCGEAMPTILRPRGVPDATPWRYRAGTRNLPISHPTEVADIVDAYTVRRLTIGQIADSKGVSYATIHRLLIVAGVPRRPRGRPAGNSAPADRDGTDSDPS